MSPQTPGKHYLVRLSKTYEDEMIFESGVRLFKPTHINPEWHTTVTGEIVATPKGSPYLPGDTLLFTYDVVEDKEVRDRETPLHRNQFYHDGGYFWKVDDLFVLGAIRNSELLAHDDYVFLQPIEAESVRKVGLLWMPDSAEQKQKKNRGEGISGEWKGKVIVYDERFGQKYTVRIDGKEQQLIVLPKQYLAGTED